MTSNQAMQKTKEVRDGEYLRAKYPGRIPLILSLDKVLLDRLPTSTTASLRLRYLVPSDMTIGKFVHFFRTKYLQVFASEALFYFDERTKTVLTPSCDFGSLYKTYQSKPDHMLNVFISMEAAFGGDIIHLC